MRRDRGVDDRRAVQKLLHHQPGEDRRGACEQLVVELWPRGAASRGTSRASAGSDGMHRSRRDSPGLAHDFLVAVVGDTRGWRRRTATAASAAASSTSLARSPRVGGVARPRRVGSGHRGRPTPGRRASAARSFRRGQNSRGRKLTMVSIMSIGAGSVGVSARPALPTTMSTSGNRQRTMSRAFRSSTRLRHRCPRHGDRHVHDHALVQRRQELARQRRHRLVGDQGDDQEQARRARARRHRRRRQHGRRDHAPANRVARKSGRLPSGAKPSRNVTPRIQASAAGWSSRYDRTGR